MELRLTLVDVRVQGRCTDLDVSAPEHACWGDLLDAVPETLMAGVSAYAWYADGLAMGRDAPLGVPPLVDGVFVVHDPLSRQEGRRPPPGAGGLLELHVVEGPDCGRIVRLRLGALRIGRSGDADLQLRDPTLSRVHAELTVTHDGIRARDLRTTNGTFVDDVRLPADGTAPIAPGQRLSAGASTMVVRLPHLAPAASRPDRRGHVSVNRGPRELIRVPEASIRMPTRPPAPEALRLPVLTMVLPLILSAAVAAVLHSPAMLLFGLMGPVMLLGSHLGDRRGRRHGSRRRQGDYVRSRGRAEAELAAALDHEAHTRRRQSPDLAALMSAVQGPAATVWQRRPDDPDFLHVRVGSARLPAALTLIEDRDGREGTQSHPLLPGVPVALALADIGILGLTGPRELALGSVRSMIGQLCGWHSPRDVQLMVLIDGAARAADWSWLSWLPHARISDTATTSRVGVLGEGLTQVADRVAELGALIHERRSLRGPGPFAGASVPHPAVVVVLDGARRLRVAPGLSRMLEQGPSVGIYFVCLDTELARLPLETRASVTVSAQGTSARVQPRPDEEQLTCTPGLVDGAWIERLCRALSPLRDATPQQGHTEPPEAARLLDVLDLDATNPTAIEHHWQAQPRTTSCTIGVSAIGTQSVDLRREGPHALVGGTTGSGKSELLQTMITALALGNRPDEMVFVLVDYKGGSAFKDCARLPHTVGMVTDLDDHLTARALTSLAAELKRREHLLGSVGAKDLEDYQRLSDANVPTMPRLVLIIDEFKMLAEELPDFVVGLVKIAAVGRSLGVHLILATQRPGGIVSSDIKANVNLRIALRVRDKADSDDVIEAPDAAAISERFPGRAMMRSGGNPVQLFQAARVGGHALADAEQPVQVRRLSPLTMGEPAPPPACAVEDSTTDLCRIVEAIRGAATHLDVPEIVPPWLPPLPACATLPTRDETPDWHVPYAVADLPSEQSQLWVVWDLERGGHLAFAGSARSGRTTALRTLAASLVERCSPAQVQLYAFDGSGALRVLTDLPHAGAVIARDESARGDRLLQRLLDEVGTRQQIWTDRDYSSLAEQQAAAQDELTNQPLPYVVVLVDGWEVFTQAYEDVDHGRPVEAMLQLLREGPSVGVRVVVTGDRSVLLSRLASLIPDRICLRMADEADLLLAGLSTRSVPAAMPPGRGVRVRDGVELQVALLEVNGASAVDGSGSAQVRALRRIVERCRAQEQREPHAGTRPLRVDPLPRSITLAQSLQHQRHCPQSVGSESIVLGVGGDDLASVSLPITAQGLSFLVAGPTGSGRTSALAVMASQLAALGRSLILIAEPGSALLGRAELTPLRHLEPSDHGSLQRAVVEHPDLIAIVDDAERLAGTPAEDTLVDLVRSARRTGGGVVCSGSIHELLGIFRGLTTEVRRQQTGLLLNPSAPNDGELFGVRVTRCSQPVPGRGILMTRGRLTDLQVALTDVPTQQSRA